MSHQASKKDRAVWQVRCVAPQENKPQLARIKIYLLCPSQPQTRSSTFLTLQEPGLSPHLATPGSVRTGCEPDTHSSTFARWPPAASAPSPAASATRCSISSGERKLAATVMTF